ncbi:hypothetical protein BJ912DRAFT_1072338 [Pholiota molesta]|nr:hypothetical protein BJ912DRAFT_1072338 [Pholiota molesta]
MISASPDTVRRGILPAPRRTVRRGPLQTRAAMRPSATDGGGASATPGGDGDGDDAADAPARPERAWEAKTHHRPIAARPNNSTLLLWPTSTTAKSPTPAFDHILFHRIRELHRPRPHTLMTPVLRAKTEMDTEGLWHLVEWHLVEDDKLRLCLELQPPYAIASAEMAGRNLDRVYRFPPWVCILGCLNFEGEHRCSSYSNGSEPLADEVIHPRTFQKF